MPEDLKAPSIRLAESGTRGRRFLADEEPLPTPPVAKRPRKCPEVRLVAPNVEGDHQGNRTLTRDGSLAPSSGEAPEEVPALLVSFAYLDPFLKNRDRYRMRDWALDSGAFTAHASGKPVVLSQFIDCAAKLLAADPKLTEVFSLDVIGDPEASIRNAEEMERQGVPVIPTFHFGSPEHYLMDIARRWPKIALGGMANNRQISKKMRLAWFAQCFARVWPKKVHGFGVAGRDALLLVPWHSTDASSWEVGPCKFGRWRSFGRMSVRGSKQNLRAEIEHYLALEYEARQRWRKEMRILEALPVLSPTLRLACVNSPAERNGSLS